MYYNIGFPICRQGQPMDQLIAVSMMYGLTRPWLVDTPKLVGPHERPLAFIERVGHFHVEMLVLMRPELAGPPDNPGWIVEVLVC